MKGYVGAQTEPMGESASETFLTLSLIELKKDTAGEAKDGKKVYEMSLNVGGSVPIIHSKTTGKWFVLSWPAIITMAVKAGIDIPDPAVDKPKRYDRVRVSDNPRVGKSFAGITGKLDLHGRMHGYEDQGDLALVIRDGGGAVGPISYEDLTKIEEDV